MPGDEASDVRPPTSTSAPVAAPSGAVQSDAQRWGVRLPRSRRQAPAPAGHGASEVRAEAPRPEPFPSGAPVSAAATPAAAPLADDVHAGVDDDEGETGPYVDELFARIRAERGPRSGEAETAGEHGAIAVLRDAATDDEPHAGTAEPGAVGASGTGTVADPEDAGDDTAAADEALDPRTAALRARDDLLTAVEREMGRRLKRVLADEQNQVLDTLRRGGTVDFADVLPPPDEHADRYAIAASNDLDLAAMHGAEAAGGATAVSCDELSGALGRTLVEPLRRRVERSFDDADGDLEEVTERLRALYREWKGQHIGRAVRHYAAAAYSLGGTDVVAKGEPQRWLVDSSCEACPDCDDNALAGEIAHGDSYPTGDTRPPAHQDCRCLVVAVTRLE